MGRTLPHFTLMLNYKSRWFPGDYNMRERGERSGSEWKVRENDSNTFSNWKIQKSQSQQGAGNTGRWAPLTSVNQHFIPQARVFKET